jgi:hypothetical protein
MIEKIVAIVFLDMVTWLFFTLTLGKDEAYFNPADNYLMWDEMNWIGVWVCTVLYWIAFLPVAIILGVGAGLYKLFTFGRG